jgi:acyl-CoA hydrolase/RimJ/RimL family protein N-acetyltransferase
VGLKAALAAAGWRDRTVTAEQAVEMLPKGAHVFISSGAATPNTFLDALASASAGHPGVRLYAYLTRNRPGEHRRPGLRYRTFFISHDLLPVAEQGHVDYIPLSLRDVSRLQALGRLRMDVGVISVSPPDAGGMCSLGASVGMSHTVIKGAPLLIAEVNAAMPRTRGDTLVPFDRFSAVIEVEPGLVEYQTPEPEESAVTDMARYVARLVPDGATLHTGPGRLINEVLGQLDRHRDLGVHSDVISDAVLDLIEGGVITGRVKSMSRGRVVASYAMGSERLYEAIDDNRRFTFRPIEEVSDPGVVMRQNRMVSITHGFSIDLTGQVCAEFRGGSSYGGVGSTAVFHYGAARSSGGRAIVCVSSTDEQGRSNIKPFLGPHEPVTIPRYEAHWVITEYGSAFLYGSTVRQRAIALIEIAHPDFRESLLDEAKALRLLPADQKIRSRSSFPVDEVRTVTLKDGTDVLIRPTKATDAPLLQDLFYRLNPEDVRTRFFRNLSAMTRQMAEHFTSVSYWREMAFAAVIGEEENERIIATSSYYLDPSTRKADVAYLVDPDYQGLGLGTLMHRRTVEYASTHGVRGFTADVLNENGAMIEVFHRGPGTLSTRTHYGVVELELDFDEIDGPEDELDVKEALDQQIDEAFAE